MYKLLSLLLLLLMPALGFAQLERRPWFGAQIEYVKENGNSGIKIIQVHGGTSAALKLQTNDLLTKIGDATFVSSEDFVAKFLTYKTKDEIKISLVRGKKEIVQKAAVVGRPFETDDNATVIYDEAAYKGGQLRVIINKPFKEGKMPAMLFIPGYTCSSIDELTEDHPYKRIVNAYVDAGYVTFRIEKSG